MMQDTCESLWGCAAKQPIMLAWFILMTRFHTKQLSSVSDAHYPPQGDMIIHSFPSWWEQAHFRGKNGSFFKKKVVQKIPRQ